MEYQVASDVAKVAKPLIEKYHPQLKGVRIIYLFQTQRDKKTGAPTMPLVKKRPVLGLAKLVTGLNAFLVSGATRTDGDDIQPFFVILITKYAWEKLKQSQREALVDHELCHCGIGGDEGKLTLLPHDLDEFNCIVQRHGAWEEGVEAFLNAAMESKQIAMTFEIPKSKRPVKLIKQTPANGGAPKDPEPEPPTGLRELKAAVRAKRGGGGRAAAGVKA